MDATKASKAFFFKKTPWGHYKDSFTNKCQKGLHILQIIAKGHSQKCPSEQIPGNVHKHSFPNK